MTIALAVAALVVLLFAIGLVQHARRPPADRFSEQALTRVIERHERDQVGRE